MDVHHHCGLIGPILELIPVAGRDDRDPAAFDGPGFAVEEDKCLFIGVAVFPGSLAGGEPDDKKRNIWPPGRSAAGRRDAGPGGGIRWRTRWLFIRDDGEPSFFTREYKARFYEGCVSRFSECHHW